VQIHAMRRGGEIWGGGQTFGTPARRMCPHHTVVHRLVLVLTYYDDDDTW
jgi:hypothetical protein